MVFRFPRKGCCLRAVFRGVNGRTEPARDLHRLAAKGCDASDVRHCCDECRRKRISGGARWYERPRRGRLAHQPDRALHRGRLGALGSLGSCSLHPARCRAPCRAGTAEPTYGRLSGRPNLDAMLVARHRALDRLLEREIAAGRVGQVIEIAAGLAGRGYRFARRFPALRYVETDLADMAAYKRRALDEAGLRGPNHEVRPLDALAGDGPASLGAVAAELVASRGLAIITEGLLSYLARDAVLTLWRRVAATIRGFAHGFYLSDLHLAADVDGMWIPELFRVGLELFARGRYATTLPRPTRPWSSSAPRVSATTPLPSVRGRAPDRPGREPAHVIRVLAATT